MLWTADEIRLVMQDVEYQAARVWVGGAVRDELLARLTDLLLELEQYGENARVQMVVSA